MLIVFGPRLLLQINELYLETSACGYSDPSFIPYVVATSYWVAKDGLYADILQRNTLKFSRVSDFVPDFTSAKYNLKALYLGKYSSESSQIRGIICSHYALSIDVKIENGESCTLREKDCTFNCLLDNYNVLDLSVNLLSHGLD